ncbi:hypothetical protein CBR_g24171 [Chara braunii]|uniref:Protein dpy-30 homolog n=1 Tax=Chara braunii TaxID=69332 RepID=A0A388L611_CHABU|nr:hypothetical protein CBR_g24171 [Chara braunii]|eukprot:GBG77724.1 hypothetical protein CBR_g24171 [Chara braunii]
MADAKPSQPAVQSDGSAEQQQQQQQQQQQEAASQLPKQEDQGGKTEEWLPPEAGAGFDNPLEGLAAQRAAMELQGKIELHALPVRNYLESSVVPILLQALYVLVRERPENPVEYLAAFLLKNNPQKPTQPVAAVAAAAGAGAGAGAAPGAAAGAAPGVVAGMAAEAPKPT